MSNTQIRNVQRNIVIDKSKMIECKMTEWHMIAMFNASKAYGFHNSTKWLGFWGVRLRAPSVSEKNIMPYQVTFT